MMKTLPGKKGKMLELCISKTKSLSVSATPPLEMGKPVFQNTTKELR